MVALVYVLRLFVRLKVHCINFRFLLVRSITDASRSIYQTILGSCAQLQQNGDDAVIPRHQSCMWIVYFKRYRMYFSSALCFSWYSEGLYVFSVKLGLIFFVDLMTHG